MVKKQNAGSIGTRATKNPNPPANPQVISELHHQHICEAAYYLSEKRGFESGSEIDDWIEAEQIIINNEAITNFDY